MRLGAAVKRAAMAGETDNSVMERHEIESDFRKFGNYNKYTFEQSIRPVQVHMEENRLHHAVTPPEVVSPKPYARAELVTFRYVLLCVSSSMHTHC